MSDLTYRVIAVDPGKMSGIAAYSTATHTLGYIGEHDFHGICAQLRRELESARLWGEIPVVVVEKFIMTGGAKTPAPWSLEVTGALRYITWSDDAGTEFNDTQKPDDAKVLITDEVLKSLNAWRPTPDGHQNDAIRHVFRYLIGRGWCTRSVLQCILDLAGREQE